MSCKKSIEINAQGGIYCPGRDYDRAKKMAVGVTYLHLFEELFLNKPPTLKVATQAKVSWKYAEKIMEEIDKYGMIIEPSTIKAQKRQQFQPQQQRRRRQRLHFGCTQQPTTLGNTSGWP